MPTESTGTTSRALWLLTAAIAVEIAATLSLKAALTNPWFYVVVVAGYLAAFTLLDQVLRAGMKIGVAYGLWAALGVAGTAVLSHVFFAEPLNAQMLAGIGVIIAGVLCIELGGRAR